MASKFLNVDIDNTLGGNSASDTKVASQKAIKDYVDLTVQKKQDALIAGDNINISGVLPTGYTALEYIQSSGTQYIDTGVLQGDAKTYSLEMVYRHPGDTVVSNTSICGAQMTNKNAFGAIYYNTNSGGRVLYSGRPNTASNTVVPTVAGEIYIDRYTVDVVTGTVTTDFNGTKQTTTGKTFTPACTTTVYLFAYHAYNGSAGQPSHIALYSARIWKDDKVVFLGIPAKRNSDSVIGVYDAVSQTFLVNVGTGTFIAGPETKKVIISAPNKQDPIIAGKNLQFEDNYDVLEYIQSSGTQYIDTGYVFQNNKGKLDIEFAKLSNAAMQGWGSYVSAPSPGTRSLASYFSGTATRNVQVGGQNFNLPNELTNDKFYHLLVDVDNGSVIVDLDGTEVINSTYTGTIVNGKSWYLFALNYNGAVTLASLKVKHVKLYDNNVLVRYLVPVKRQSDSAIGMYDCVTGQFFANAGTGTFIAGPVANKQIISATTQEIDNSTITKNSSGSLQASAVVNQIGSGIIKTWKGTLAEYNAITTKSNDTQYIITDDETGGASVYTKAETDAKIVEDINEVRTNCITEIPQDIKLEIFDDSGTKKLRLKAGSKVYVPAGSGTFNTVTTTTDIVCQGTDGTATTMVFYRMDGQVWGNTRLSDCNSGTTTPSFGMFYNTSTNKVNFYNNSVIADANDFSFPIAIITFSSGNLLSIDQVFNGLGYIGATVFALPGVKGLIPNGRNSDGSLKNTEFINEVCVITTLTGTHVFSIRLAHNYLAAGVFPYDEKTNRNYNDTIAPGNERNQANAGSVSVSSGKITSFKSKQVFHTVDYNDTEFVAHQAMPSSEYVNLTLGASGNSYVAPADGYFCISIKTTANNQVINLINSTAGGLRTAVRSPTANDDIYLYLPASKGDVVYSYFSPSIGTAEFFRFVYANGTK